MNIEQQIAIEEKVIKDKRNARLADTIIVSPRYLGNEFLSDLPLEVRKPCSLSNLTPCANLVTRGIMSNVEHIERTNKPLYSLTNCDTAIPMVTPSQNIKFQKLSLLSLALIQFILICVFRVDDRIVTTLRLLLKEIKNATLVTILLFSNSVANAESLKDLISDTEKKYSIPQGLLYSIATVESRVNPHAINIEGKAILTTSQASALEVIKYHRNQGHTNIDIGIMQINYRWHGKEFASLDAMLQVDNNVEYAAKFLASLYKEHGSWHKATRLYHSATPKHHTKYSKKIITAWLKT